MESYIKSEHWLHWQDIATNLSLMDNTVLVFNLTTHGVTEASPYDRSIQQENIINRVTLKPWLKKLPWIQTGVTGLVTIYKMASRDSSLLFNTT